MGVDDDHAPSGSKMMEAADYKQKIEMRRKGLRMKQDRSSRSEVELGTDKKLLTTYTAWFQKILNLK